MEGLIALVTGWPENSAGSAYAMRGEALNFLDFFFGSFLLYQDKRNVAP